MGKDEVYHFTDKPIWPHKLLGSGPDPPPLPLIMIFLLLLLYLLLAPEHDQVAFFYFCENRLMNDNQVFFFHGMKLFIYFLRFFNCYLKK